MTQNISESFWAKTSIAILLLLAMTGVWAYLSGAFLLLAFHKDYNSANLITYYQYWYHYRTDKAVEKWLLITGGVSFAFVMSPLLVFLIPSKRSLFGDARFAKNSEIRKSGLLGEKGLIVGKYAGRYLMLAGQQHVIMSAPTRSGKGVGVVIPNLLNWPDSVVVLDIKQENWNITSGYRRKYGQACYLFNPAATDYRTHRYNPLHYINSDPNFRIDDVQKIANMLFPDQVGTDVIWTATPRSFFLGVVLYLIETPGKLVTIGQVLRESLVDGDGSHYFARIINARAAGEKADKWTEGEAVQQVADDVMTFRADAGNVRQAKIIESMAINAFINAVYQKKLEDSAPDASTVVRTHKLRDIEKAAASVRKALSPVCVRALNSFISISSENTRAGVITSFRSRLELWMNPLVDAATSANDFDLRDIRKKRMSIYLGVTPDNLERLAPLMNLLFQQLIDLNTRELPNQNKSLKFPCLLLMDEFTAIGKMGILSKGISYIAGYGLRMMPIIQSPSQLMEVYGKDAAQTFTTNHALQIVFPPKASETQTAKDISEWLGYQTVKGVSESKGTEIFSKRNKSENISDQRRALMLPQEITGLGQDKELVILENVPPILAKKIVYYKSADYVDRLKLVSASLGRLGKKLPNQHQMDHAINRGELAADVPLINLEEYHKLVGGDNEPVTVAIPQQQTTAQTVTIKRDATPTDIPLLDTFSVTGFDAKFTDIPIPAKGAMDIGALNAYAVIRCLEAGVEPA